MQVNPYEPPKFNTESLPSRALISDRLIRYSVDFEDILEFQKFHFAHSATMRNQIFGLMGIIALFTGAAGVLILSDFSLPMRLAVATVVATLSAIAIREFLMWSISRQTRKLLRQGSNDGMVGDHQLIIEERFLTELTSVNETRHAFAGIVRIEETDDYAFIYISSLQAHAIPKKKMQYGDLVGFMARLRELVPGEKHRTKS